VAEGRGLFTGNRGCLVDGDGEVTRHHQGNLWIICETSYKGWRHPLAAPRVWTPIFFLDEAVALAAGHRPCGLCRRDDYHRYLVALTRHLGLSERPSATELNRMLALERHRRGRGIDRAPDRRLWEMSVGEVPAGAVVVRDGETWLVTEEQLMRFSFDGWTGSVERPSRGTVTVLTPPSSVAALRGGYRPRIHLTAQPGPDESKRHTIR
jgi:hypothetical protein